MIKGKESKKIITDIVPVRDENGEAIYIDIALADGTSFPVPNTKSALLHYRNIMLKQVMEQRKLICSTKRNFNASMVMAIAGLAGVVLVNTTEFGKEIGPLAGSIVSGAITLTGGTGVIVNSKKLSRIQRNVTFACHRNEINKCIAENPHIYMNVSEKDKKLIEEWLRLDCNEAIVIENLDMLDLFTIQQIWQNMCLYEYFGFKYKTDGRIEEPGFQKIKVKEQ